MDLNDWCHSPFKKEKGGNLLTSGRFGLTLLWRVHTEDGLVVADSKSGLSWKRNMERFGSDRQAEENDGNVWLRTA